MYTPNATVEYDSEPVLYCANCYSLRIQHEDAVDSDFCRDCGCSEIKETSIENWERLYEIRYGHSYIHKNSDPTKSPIFRLSISELKEKVSSSSKWKEIIKSIYPHFPKGYGRIDALLLFFDKIIKDNKINDLRLLLYKKLGSKVLSHN